MTIEAKAPLANRFDRMEWAGAFGDLGTLVPFVVAYIAVLGVDPFGVLLAFGVSLVTCGLYYKTPFPVQPMKAICAMATTQAAQTATITAGALYAASFVTGLIWLLLGVTGLTKRVTDLISRPVAIGIVLGLGIGFMIEGSKLMAVGWTLSAGLLVLTLLLLSNRIIPVMFLLLIGGAGVALFRDPQLLAALGAVHLEPRIPKFALGIFAGQTP